MTKFKKKKLIHQKLIFKIISQYNNVFVLVYFLNENAIKILFYFKSLCN